MPFGKIFQFCILCSNINQIINALYIRYYYPFSLVSLNSWKRKIVVNKSIIWIADHIISNIAGILSEYYFKLFEML